MTSVTIEPTIAIDQDRASLERIARRETALAIWGRTMPQAAQAAIEALDLDTIDDLIVSLDANESSAPALRSAGYPAAAGALLSDDIDLLVGRHAALTGSDRLRVRLEVIETDACRRFHADYVTLRMLCTYVGPGTQWCRADAPDAICEVPTGAVGVFKGRLLLDPPTVLHRSPPIVDTGQRRLVLVIDPAERAAA